MSKRSSVNQYIVENIFTITKKLCDKEYDEIFLKDEFIFNKLYLIILYLVHNDNKYNEFSENILDILYELRTKTLSREQYLVSNIWLKSDEEKLQLIFDCLDKTLPISSITEFILNPDIYYVHNKQEFSKWIDSIKIEYPQYADQIDKILLLK